MGFLFALNRRERIKTRMEENWMGRLNNPLTVEKLYKILKTLVENGEGSREVEVIEQNNACSEVHEVRLDGADSLWIDTRRKSDV